MRGVPSSVMPGFMPGIHVFLVAKTWMASELGLARVRQIKKTVSRVNPTYGDEPGHDARDLNAAMRLEVDGCAAASAQQSCSPEKRTISITSGLRSWLGRVLTWSHRRAETRSS